MWSSLIEAAIGLVLAGMTLRDVFDTVVVPERTHGLLKISRRLVRIALPLWKHVRHRAIGVNFAPLVLVGSFMVWMLLLVLGFALLVHAAALLFTPPIAHFSDAVYVAGSAMSTIGTGDMRPAGAGRLVIVAAGFCGLAVMTLGVTYLLEVQSTIAQRDAGVLKIATAAGRPPSALGLLEKYGQLGCHAELPELLRSGRDWCAGVLQSHVSHPWLIYFRSAGTESGWPATLGTLVDLALILEHLVDDPSARGAAVLAREEADRLAHDVGALLALQPQPDEIDPAEIAELRARLAAAGYRLRSADDAAFIARRRQHLGPIHALSRHLGTAPTPLVG